MGRRAVVTREDVFTVADTMAEDGLTPTVRAIQERTGGSYSTISPYFTEWKAEHTAPPVPVPDIPERVQTAFNQVWVAAAKAAQEDMETQRQALEALRVAMEKEQADMAAEIERLETELEEAQEQGETLQRALDTEREAREKAEEQVTDLRIENARLDERSSAAEDRAGELRDQLAGLQDRFALAVEKAGQGTKRGRSSTPKNKPEPQDP